MVNMGELFAYERISNVAMDRVPVSEKEYGFVLEAGDLLFARQSLVLEGAGQCSIFVGNCEPTVFESHIIRCRLDESRADPNFYFYFLKSHAGKATIGQIVEQGAGASGIRGSDLATLIVPVPPLAFQQAVADILRSVDDRIDLLRKINTTLEAIAQALFKAWFVDFDPVHAKAEGREPEVAAQGSASGAGSRMPGSATDAATAALFPSEFEASELGLIPKGWRPGALSDVSHLNAMSWSTKHHPDTVAYVDLSAVHTNRIATINEFLFSEAPSRARRSLRDGDTIVGTVRPGNRAFAYIHSPAANLTGSTGFAVLSPMDGIWTPFVYLAATRADSIDRLANLADGGAYPAVRPDVVAATPVVIPLLPIITAFSLVVAPLLHKIGENQAEEATLAELRDTLLPRLISGKLRLPDAEREIETTP